MEKPDLSFHSRVAVKLRLAEKEILERAASSGRAKREHFQAQLEEGAPLPKYEESNISLLENSDSASKLPIILQKLEEAESAEPDLSLGEELVEAEPGEGEGPQAPLLNGEGKAPHQANGDADLRTVDSDADPQPANDGDPRLGDVEPQPANADPSGDGDPRPTDANCEADPLPANGNGDGDPRPTNQMTEGGGGLENGDAAASHPDPDQSARRTGDEAKDDGN